MVDKQWFKKPLRPCNFPGRPFSDQDILESAYEGLSMWAWENHCSNHVLQNLEMGREILK